VRTLKNAVIALLLLASAAGAQSASSDSVTVTVTPDAYYAIEIDTTGVTMDLGTLDLDYTTYTIKPATVTIESTFAATDVRVLTQITGGWSLDADASSRETDALQAWAVFTDTGIPSQPVTAGAFSGTAFGAHNSDLLGATNAQYAGTAGGVTQYVLLPGEAGYKPMDGVASALADAGGSKAHLWLKFRLPQVTTTASAQSITITLGAAAPVP